MHNFWSLAGYEYKKLLKRKMVLITIGILTALSIYQPFSTLLGSTTNGSVYENLMVNKTDARAIAGRKINDELLQEFESSGKRIPSGLSYFLNTIFEQEELKGVTEEKIYETRNEILASNWENNRLSPGEIQHLKEQEAQLEIPFTYQYCDGYKRLMAIIYSIGIMLTLFISSCIPAIFADEHIRKMDQLILCTSEGKKTLFLAKIFVGTTASLAVAILLLAASAIPTFFIYGTEGFAAQIQLVVTESSWPISIGELVLILAALILTATLPQSAMAMFLAERLRSSAAAMAIMLGVMLLAVMISIPPQIRVLAQIWDYVPTNIVKMWGDCNNWLVSVFGNYFTQWQMAPVIYLIISVAAALGGYHAYRNYQTAG